MCIKLFYGDDGNELVDVEICFWNSSVLQAAYDKIASIRRTFIVESTKKSENIIEFQFM